ncbi:DUF551 domain-containing protein [Burkholderia pseudomallei]|uniref:DUF551 domain-containing protein n=2 Tax=Burkholderia pseudomallei TaxID=28450 RepID=UPI000A1A1B00|nr:DUF551 domain-containing protein [Burkholderia pseudomallei]ARL77583.1 hypothetical protein BOC54_36920 [Burkholderia pseudomallei]ARL84188.1 hypothetical protein BOC55_35245 [Burkholderia pseudomallei]
MKTTSAFDWIRTTDKLPPAATRGHLSEYMLVTVAEKFRYVDIDRYDHHTHAWEAHGTSATHWMPLPPPAALSFSELAH